MTPQDFTYWLQGFFELSGATSLTPEQVKIIKEHLSLVFKKETKTNISSTTDYIYYNGNNAGTVIYKDPPASC